MQNPVLKDVTITQQSADGISAYYLVSPIWADVDRPDVGGYSCGRNLNLARRLQTAIKSGKLWLKPPQFEIDIDGKSYVQADIQILMRRANSELQKLGF